MGSYRDLVVWQKAMDLATEVHGIVKRFPTDERYGLSAQLRRASVSIPSNIAEGKGRWTTKDFAAFLMRARGSLHEVETQILLAIRFNYLTESETSRVFEQSEEVGRLLNGLIRSLQEAPSTIRDGDDVNY